jgi:hypothetical protein
VEAILFSVDPVIQDVDAPGKEAKGNNRAYRANDRLGVEKAFGKNQWSENGQVLRPLAWPKRLNQNDEQ